MIIYYYFIFSKYLLLFLAMYNVLNNYALYTIGFSQAPTALKNILNRVNIFL